MIALKVVSNFLPLIGIGTVPIKGGLLYVSEPAGDDDDALLRQVAERLTACHLRLCGVVQINERVPGARHCDMTVRILPNGPDLGISQSLGPAARGCRLDTDALERAAATTSSRLGKDTSVFILNKFGKHEAEGRGFRSVIGEALFHGVPVLLKISPLNLGAFTNFSAGYADRLEPSPDVLTNWVLSYGFDSVENGIDLPGL